MDVERIQRLIIRLRTALAELEAALVDIEPPDETPVDELEIGVRAFNCLNGDGIKAIGQLRARSDSRLLEIPNFGRGSLAEVKQALWRHAMRGARRPS